jgi:hypothetical protein
MSRAVLLPVGRYFATIRCTCCFAPGSSCRESVEISIPAPPLYLSSSDGSGIRFRALRQGIVSRSGSTRSPLRFLNEPQNFGPDHGLQEKFLFEALL